MNHKYVSIADFNAPFNGAQYLHGLGAWPPGRSYWSTANFRAPYANGYFQNNTLTGLGASVKEDFFVVLRQVPTWMYVAGGLGFSYLAYKGYQGKKEK